MAQKIASTLHIQWLVKMARYTAKKSYLQELDTAAKAQQATNTVVFVRVFLKYLTESLNADDLVAFLDAPQRAARIQANATDVPGHLDKLQNANIIAQSYRWPHLPDHLCHSISIAEHDSKEKDVSMMACGQRSLLAYE